MLQTRTQQFQALFPKSPVFRLRQCEEALFHRGWTSWSDVSNLSKEMREEIIACIPWFSVQEVFLFSSKDGQTFKTVLAVEGGNRIETVLMKNKREQWTVCVSSQIGCAMRCSFCATGTMGLMRNLSSDEIIDQIRYWYDFLEKRPDLPQRISNVVFMGMGEPLANYDAVKEVLQLLLRYTDIGPTRITVSTVGLVPMLEKVLNDDTWPPVRLAISLHSADEETRKAIMPSSYDGFLEKLADWADRYFEKFASKRRHITFEYIMLDGVNDTPRHAKALAQFSERVGKVRVNLIPYNTTQSQYAKSQHHRLDAFVRYLKERGVEVTKRRTMGDDIAAACGQLVIEGNPTSGERIDEKQTIC
jgi:adenine C2-methylase RlmN of 23S rRNA A2503 and tRNA A37